MSRLPIRSNLKLGIVGAGCIGRRIAQATTRPAGELDYSVTAIHDLDAEAARQLAADFAPEAKLAGLAETAQSCDVLVECAAGSVVPNVIQTARETHSQSGNPSHVLVMSVGGLLDVSTEHAGGPVIHVPAGAIGGLEAIQAMAVAGLDEVVLTTRKPPGGLGMDVEKETVLFEGSAKDVIKDYPKNVNVAIALSLAGIGADKTRVRLIADPAVDRNTHHIKANGKAGEIEFTSRNLPFPENPKTSYLAALSAIAVLRRLYSRMLIG